MTAESLIAQQQHHILVVRPLGTQQEIDFDKVEQKLIAPALRQLGILNATTVTIPKQGDVPMALFQQFLAAALVITDISIPNPSLLYHLKLRKTLSDRATFLLCANGNEDSKRSGKQEYFFYHKANPAAALDKLVESLYRITDSINPEHLKFKLLAECEAAVPPDFRKEVERTVVNKHKGDLELLAGEICGFNWESDGMRLIGCAELALKMTTLTRSLLFATYTADPLDHGVQNFTADTEEIVKNKIKSAITEELELWGTITCGLAGGVNREDILFHETCAELGIATRLYLAFPEEKFVNALSVIGAEWVARFQRLRAQLPTRVLAKSESLPAWLHAKPHYSIRQRYNLWILYNAIADAGNDNLTLLALSIGKEGTDHAGIGDLVEQARLRNVKTVILDMNKLSNSRSTLKRHAAL